MKHEMKPWSQLRQAASPIRVSLKGFRKAREESLRFSEGLLLYHVQAFFKSPTKGIGALWDQLHWTESDLLTNLSPSPPQPVQSAAEPLPWGARTLKTHVRSLKGRQMFLSQTSCNGLNHVPQKIVPSPNPGICVSVTPLEIGSRQM